MAQDLFRSRYPRVALAPSRSSWTTGACAPAAGATSFLTLAAYLVEKYCGAEAARLMAKIFLIDINKGPQTAYAIFSAQKNHGDARV